MFWKKELVYVDTLQEWRNVKVWDFNMLDKVWVLETCEQALSRIPWYHYSRKNKWDPVEWIIIGKTYDTYFSSDKEFNAFEKMEFGWKSTDWEVCYRAPGYKVLLKNWNIVDWYEIKKSHGEFQEEFELMNALEQKRIDVQLAQKRYDDALTDMSKLLEDWRKMQAKLSKKL